MASRRVQAGLTTRAISVVGTAEPVAPTLPSWLSHVLTHNLSPPAIKCEPYFTQECTSAAGACPLHLDREQGKARPPPPPPHPRGWSVRLPSWKHYQLIRSIHVLGFDGSHKMTGTSDIELGKLSNASSNLKLSGSDEGQNRKGYDAPKPSSTTSLRWNIRKLSEIGRAHV